MLNIAFVFTQKNRARIMSIPFL